MKLVLTIFLFILTFFCKAQNREQIIDLIEDSKKNFDKVRIEYFDQLDKNDYFDYGKGGSRTYINKKKYDSLVRKNIPDSIVIKNSIFSVDTKAAEHYIYKIAHNYLDKYKNDRILSRYHWGEDAYKGFSFEDFINLIYFSVEFNPDASIKSFGYSKFAKLDPENKYGFSDMIYSVGKNERGIYIEQYPLKDFTMTEEQVFNHLLANFPEQSVELMKNIKYARKYGDTEKKFDYLDAKYELLLLRGKIQEKRKAQEGLYDDKDYVTKYRAIKGINLEKRYDEENNAPFYFVSTSDGYKSWKFYMDSKTGKIIKILFEFVIG